MRQVPALLVSYLTGGDLPWIVIAGWMLAGVFLMLVIAGAMPIREGEAMQDTERHSILQAHPEWRGCPRIWFGPHGDLPRVCPLRMGSTRVRYGTMKGARALSSGSEVRQGMTPELASGRCRLSMGG